MRKLYFKSRDGYRPSLTQRIEQFFRCRRGKHIWLVNDVVVDLEVVGEVRICEHCKKEEVVK